MRHPLIITVLCLFGHAGCQGQRGSGTLRTETRQLPSFTAVEVGGAYQLTVAAGRPQSFELSGDDNIVPLVMTDVRSGRLTVTTHHAIQSRLPLRLTITLPKLQALAVSGAARAVVHGIRTDSFELDLSGAGTVTLDGAAPRLKIEASGAGTINALDLQAESVEVQLSGAGSADVHATRSLVAKVSGVGRVRYRGKPQHVAPEISGAGSISPL